MANLINNQLIPILFAIMIGCVIGVPVCAAMQVSPTSGMGTSWDSLLLDYISDNGLGNNLARLSGTLRTNEECNACGKTAETGDLLIDDQFQTDSTGNDGHGPMDLTLTISKIPLVNEETTITCELISTIDSPGTEIKIDGKEYLMMREDEILAVIEK